ncbi:MAG: hypothetical protein H7841_02785 [Magnetospirillum sp. WYHS-4]
MFDLFLKLIGVATLVTWLLWAVSMTGNLLVPRPEFAGAPMEVPLTPIYRIKPQHE